MTATQAVTFGARGFWALDDTLRIWLTYLIAAIESPTALVARELPGWERAALVSDFGLDLPQLDRVSLDQIRFACGVARAALTEAGATSGFEGHARIGETVHLARVLETADAFEALLVGALPPDPMGGAWLFGTGQGAVPLAMRGPLVPVPLPERIRLALASTRGFMPPDEGAFLFEQAHTALAHGPVLEIGSYCGLSALYLGGAALARGSGVVYTVDHHTGSEELQPGWEHHDPDLIDPATRRMNSLPFLLDTLDRGGLTDLVRPIVGRSTEVASRWTTPLAMVFIDGGHSAAEAHGDYDAWSRHVMPGGLLVIHDVFPDPADGGRPPYEIYLRALSDGYVEVSARGSMRALIKPR